MFYFRRVMLEISWIITIISITALILNAMEKIINWYFFIVVNVLWIIFNLSIGVPAQAFYFFVGEFVNIYGLWKWSKKAKKINWEEAMVQGLKELRIAIPKREERLAQGAKTLKCAEDQPFIFEKLKKSGPSEASIES